MQKAPPDPGREQGMVSLEAYQRHGSEISLVMSHFLLPYLLTLYREFKGDLAMVIVLGEIAHHNLSGHFGPRGLSEEAAAALHGKHAFQKELPGCNAFSLAAATGLPRETVRRKIVAMERRGWLERTPDRGFRMTPKVAEHFLPDTNYHMMLQLLVAAGRIQEILHKASPPAS